MKKYFILVLFVLTLMTPGLSRRKMFELSEQQELQLGIQVSQEIDKTSSILQDEKVNTYITKLGTTLKNKCARNYIPFMFKVVNTSDINAFALPGGFIYVNRGLIEAADNESELVGVLAHEIGHVSQKHGVEQFRRIQRMNLGLNTMGVLLGASGSQNAQSLMQISQLVGSGVFMKHSRDAEREADEVGASLTYVNGWNPNGMITFFQKLEKLSGGSGVDFLSSHPSPEERYNNVQKFINEWGVKSNDPNFIITSNEFNTIKTYLKYLPPAPKNNK